MITFILASIYSDVRGAGPLLPLSSPLCARLRDEAEGMDDERGAVMPRMGLYLLRVEARLKDISPF